MRCSKAAFITSVHSSGSRSSAIEVAPRTSQKSIVTTRRSPVAAPGSAPPSRAPHALQNLAPGGLLAPQTGHPVMAERYPPVEWTGSDAEDLPRGEMTRGRMFRLELRKAEVFADALLVDAGGPTLAGSERRTPRMEPTTRGDPPRVRRLTGQRRAIDPSRLRHDLEQRACVRVKRFGQDAPRFDTGSSATISRGSSANAPAMTTR